MMSTRSLNLASGRLGFGLAIALGCAAAATAPAQPMSASISVLPISNRVMIEGSCPATTKWSFLDVYGGIIGLGRRIEQFTVSDAEGQSIQVRQLAPGQFESAKSA